MKGRIRRLVAMVVLMSLIGSMNIQAAEMNVTFTQANQIFQIIGQGDNKEDKGPILITQGTLKTDGTSRSIYLVTLYGVDEDSGQCNTFASAIKALLGQSNDYLRCCKQIINKNIPEGSSVVLAGGSLGGMVVQQLAGDSEMIARYEIIHTVAFGAPYIKVSHREGNLNRLGDTSDIVPYLCGNGGWRSWSYYLSVENGGYGRDFATAHGWSYTRSDIWGDYDVLGRKKGNATLVLNLATQTYYRAEF